MPRASMRTVKIPEGIDAQVIADYYRAREVPVEDAEDLKRIMAENRAERERGEKGSKGGKSIKSKKDNKEEGYEEHEEEKECGEKEEGVSEEKNGYVRLNQLSGRKQCRIVRK